MDCPKCVGILKKIAIGRKEPVSVDRCPACGGIWFDKDELQLLINKRIKDTSEFELDIEPLEDEALRREVDLDNRPAHCPRCGNGRDLIKEASGRDKRVQIDRCPACGGIWLDGGEFSRIARSSRMERSFEGVIDYFHLHFSHLFRKTEEKK